MRVGVTQIRFIGEGSFFRASSGIFLKAAWALYSSEKGSTIAGDLQASEIAKTIVLVVNGKEDVTVLFQSDETFSRLPRTSRTCRHQIAVKSALPLGCILSR